MIPDRRLAALAAAAYAGAPSWWRGDVHAYASEEDGATVVAFRGTQDIRDVLRDLDALPLDDESLGPCHAGFLTGVRGVEQQIEHDLLGKPVVLTGHSLGGAMALIFGARLLVQGRPPIAIVTFGAPRPGFAKLRGILAVLPELRLYRCGRDPVPDVPEWPFVDAGPRVAVGEPSHDPLDDHAVARYVGALAAPPPRG